MRKHVQVERTSLGELPVVVATHLLGHGCLAMDVFVVRERHQVVLVAKVHHREAQLVVAAGAHTRLKLEHFERVVHPAHVPLVVEAQAALLNGTRGARDIGRVLCHKEDARVQRLQAVVHGLNKVQCHVVDAAARVALPIDDAADGVHAQCIDMVGAKPEVVGRLHEAAGLPARIHEVVAAPLAYANRVVGILKEWRAVVVCEAIGVVGEVHGHHVHDHADPRLMQLVDEVHQLRRCAVAAGRGEEAGRLVAPATVKGVLVQRHELDVRVATSGQMLDQRLGNLFVGVPICRVVRRLIARALAP